MKIKSDVFLYGDWFFFYICTERTHLNFPRLSILRESTVTNDAWGALWNLLNLKIKRLGFFEKKKPLRVFFFFVTFLSICFGIKNEIKGEKLQRVKWSGNKAIWLEIVKA